MSSRLTKSPIGNLKKFLYIYFCLKEFIDVIEGGKGFFPRAYSRFKTRPGRPSTIFYRGREKNSVLGVRGEFFSLSRGKTADIEPESSKSQNLFVPGGTLKILGEIHSAIIQSTLWVLLETLEGNAGIFPVSPNDTSRMSNHYFSFC